MPIVRHAHSFDDHFTRIPNHWVRDKRLSLSAIGLITQLMSHSPGWIISQESLAHSNNIGRDAMRTILRELLEAGYLVRSETRARNGKGQLAGYTYTTCEPTLGEPTTAQPTQASPTLKKNSSKEEQVKEEHTKEVISNSFDEFWAEYPRKLDKGQAQKAFKLALTKASFEQIITGVLAYKADSTRKQEFTKYPATWLNAESWLNEIALSPDSEAGHRAKLRRDRDKEISNAYLQEQKDAQAYSAAPPQCLHGSAIARCIKCSRGLNG